MRTKINVTRRTLVQAIAIVPAIGLLPTVVNAQSIPKEIRLDWAYYSPPSMVIRKFGWMEEEFKPDGTTIKWVFSQGSNNSLEFINSGSTDFASTSGISALVARTNGFPIKMVYMLNTNEASMLMVTKDAPFKSIKDLKGKKIAATKGTDPYFFLLRALNANGMTMNDVEIVHLQHPDGLQALLRGSVSAWAGLDPHMASGEVNSGIRPLYRNAAFSSYVPLNTTESFIKNHPAALERVLKVYEKAEMWILKNMDETAQIAAAESKQSPAVIQRALTRADFTKPIPEAIHIDTIRATIPILIDEGIVKKGSNPTAALNTLVDTSITKKAVTR
jgi:sulfonate transport system substrate-binding protein